MADLSYNSYLNSNKKTKTNNLSYDSYLSSQKPKNSVFKKVGNFVKDISEDAAKTLVVRPVARTTEAITRTAFPNSLAAKGYEAMADNNESQKVLGIDVEQQKGLGQGGGKQIVGNALETAGWLYGTGKVANVAMNRAAQTSTKKFLAMMAKEGAVGALLGSAGSQMSRGEKIDPVKLAKDTATGAIAAPVLGFGLNKLLGKGASKVADKVDNVVPEEKTLLLPEGKNVIELPEKGILEGQANIRQPLKEEIVPQVGKKTSKKIVQEVPTTPKIETPTQPIREIPVETTTKDADSIASTFKEPTKYKPGTFEGWSKALRSIDRAELENVAMGGQKNIPTDVPENAYLSVMKNIADETGDIDLAQKLARSDVASLEGQGLTASKLTTADNVVDAMREVRVERMRKAGVTDAKFKQEASSLIEKLKTRINDDIINKLICP